MANPKIEYDRNGNKSREVWYKGKLRSHIICYHKNGNKSREYIINNEQFHSYITPAIRWYNENGSIRYVNWYINGDEIKAPFDNYPLTEPQIIELKLTYG